MKAKIATIAALCAMLEMILAPQQMIERALRAQPVRGADNTVAVSVFRAVGASEPARLRGGDSAATGKARKEDYTVYPAQVRRRFSWGLWAAIRWARPISPTCGGRGAGKPRGGGTPDGLLQQLRPRVPRRLYRRGRVRLRAARRRAVHNPRSRRGHNGAVLPCGR